ncbi:serine hydrolase [Prescottella sp. R16]|uniref:serine hydrolase domain-containing protein n=1 Tax=Prescottella sp. R16 TaxID=3064529 RepID=UPI00272DD26B|nr:serine hydrolase domain-containing protein [Prescottella sp. R16]
MGQSPVDGFCSERFEGVRRAFEENLTSGEELGASLVIDIEGETLVDIWGGHRDVSRTTPWTEDTLVNVWSSTKSVTALAALLLVDAGELDVFAPVARYWPDFAANGKSDIEVRHILSHTSGVSGWEQPFRLEDMYDWEGAVTRLAAQAPWWTPGTAAGYHAQNYGHLIGEVVRRITGLHLEEFVAKEIAEPLGADFQIGAREADWDRIAEIVPPPPLDIDLAALDPDSAAVKTLTGPIADAAAANTAGWRHADMGAHNGHGNARSLARILSAITLGGTSNDVRLLTDKTIDLIFTEQNNDTDLVLGVPFRRGIGFALPRLDTMPSIPEGRTAFWGGWGGSMTVMDLDRRMTFTYMMNKMGSGIIGSPRSNEYLRATYDALGAVGPA